MPKSEGRHLLLLDLSEVIDTARSDSEASGKTSVTIDHQPTALQEGVNMQLDIVVTGPFGLPALLVNLLSALPGLAGFILTYPLVLKWLERRRTPNPTSGSRPDNLRPVNARGRRRGGPRSDEDEVR